MKCVKKNPDYDIYEDLDSVTEHMLRNVTEVVEWLVDTGEDKDALIFVEWESDCRPAADYFLAA